MVSQLEEMEHQLAVNAELEEDIVDLKDNIVELEKEIKALKKRKKYWVDEYFKLSKKVDKVEERGIDIY